MRVFLNKVLEILRFKSGYIGMTRLDDMKLNLNKMTVGFVQRLVPSIDASDVVKPNPRSNSGSNSSPKRTEPLFVL